LALNHDYQEVDMVLQLVKSTTTTNGGAEDKGRAGASLREEIAILRRALYISERSLSAQGEEGEPADIARLGGVVARLSGAIVHATLAEQKLAGVGDDIAEAQAEIKRIFRAMGWGENEA
jgi:hypothetical protein